MHWTVRGDMSDDMSDVRYIDFHFPWYYRNLIANLKDERRTEDMHDTPIVGLPSIYCDMEANVI